MYIATTVLPYQPLKTSKEDPNS